jgi:hypothetical protein
LSAEAKTVQTPRGEGAAVSPSQAAAAAPVAEERERGCITVDALKTEEVQRKKEVPRMVFTFPLETIALLMTNMGEWRTSKKFRDVIILCVVVEFRVALLTKGVCVTDVQVEVCPASINALRGSGWKPGDSSTGRGLESGWTSARRFRLNAWWGNHACSRGGSGRT